VLIAESAEGSRTAGTDHHAEVNSKRWLARWVDYDQQERSESFERRVDAQRQIDGVTTALNTGTYADPQRSAIAFGAVAEEWFDSKRGAVEPKTLAGSRSLLDVVVLPKWADVRLRDVQHPEIQLTWPRYKWLAAGPNHRPSPVSFPASHPLERRAWLPAWWITRACQGGRPAR
jgi:hypothetical protein